MINSKSKSELSLFISFTFGEMWTFYLYLASVLIRFESKNAVYVQETLSSISPPKILFSHAFIKPQRASNFAF